MEDWVQEWVDEREENQGHRNCYQCQCYQIEKVRKSKNSHPGFDDFGVENQEYYFNYKFKIYLTLISMTETSLL